MYNFILFFIMYIDIDGGRGNGGESIHGPVFEGRSIFLNKAGPT